MRPEPAVLPCNTHQCAAGWISEEWGSCSKSCDGGIRVRAVVCAEEANGVKRRVADEMCTEKKLETRESCNVHPCPKWATSEWSEVSKFS